MQHHGVPTRLLDWTENAYIALFFALTDAKKETDDNCEPVYDKDKPVYKDAAVVWVLDPVKWNNKILTRSPGIVSHSDEDHSKPYIPEPVARHKDQLPIALYGAHNSPRIVAQRGVFTIFGSGTKPMEKIFKSKQFPASCLIKLKILPNAIGTLLDDLIKVGVTHSILYPDLVGLASEIRREFDFKD